MEHRTGHKRHGPKTWEAAKRDYIDGDSAPAVCERYGLGLSAFRARARVERWRRSDQPDAPPSFDELRQNQRHRAGTLADIAYLRLQDALIAGRIRDAQALRRSAACSATCWP